MGAHDLFVAKFGSDGQLLWHRQGGDIWNQASIVVAVDSLGNVIVTGAFEGTIDFGGTILESAGKEDAFVVTFDSTGIEVWNRRLGGPGAQLGTGVTTDFLGNVIVAGAMWGSVMLEDNSILAASPYSPDVFLARLARW
jgi:hypothetical protein